MNLRGAQVRPSPTYVLDSQPCTRCGHVRRTRGHSGYKRDLCFDCRYVSEPEPEPEPNIRWAKGKGGIWRSTTTKGAS